MDTNDDVVVVDDLVHSYGSVQAVRGVSFRVRRGEVFGIVGPNGAGKTTTLEIIEGLTRPTSGSVHVLGIDVVQRPREVKERIGVQLQASAYHDYLTLYEILDIFGGLYRRRLPPGELLSWVELNDKRNAQVRHLSGGLKQRFSIIAAMVNDPDVVFLDEPTTGLDPRARRSLWELVQQLHALGKTIVLTTHYMEEAEALCDRIAIMDEGRIVALDSPAALIRALPVSSMVRVRARRPLPELAEPPFATIGLDPADGAHVYEMPTSDSFAALSALLERLAGRGADVADIEVKPATLEDVFLALTGKRLEEANHAEAAAR